MSYEVVMMFANADRIFLQALYKFVNWTIKY